MKITKTTIREMILQEMATTISPKDRENRTILQYRTGPFQMLCQTAWDTLDQLEESVRMSTDLEQMDLEGFKNNELRRLKDKIGMIEGMIDAKMLGRIDEEGDHE